LRNLREDEEAFTFFVDSTEYRCSFAIAHFLSPRICQLRASDFTMISFRIETKDPSNYFADILSLGRGGTVKLSEERMAFISSVGRELWNSELANLFFPTFDDEILSENVISRLAGLSGLDLECSNELPFLASCFYKFAVSDIERLDLQILYSVLASDNLVVRNEDWLYEMIHELFCKSGDGSYFGLLEFVQFEFLSVESIQSASEWISNSFDLLTFPIWCGVCKRLVLSLRGDLDVRRRHKSQQFGQSRPS
jgi:hypothetical protein